MARLLLLLANLAPARARAQHAPRPARYQTEKFRLTAGPCAAKGYPMTIQFGAFVRPDGKTLPVPAGHTLEGKWGLSSIGQVVGDEFQPVPVSLEIRYFSYLEDTFYEGTLPLPQQRLRELLRTGFWDHRQQQPSTYNELTVCVLPKGAVVVWLVGPGRQVLVGRYQGQVSSVDFRRFYPQSDRAEMLRQKLAAAPPAVQAQVRAGTLSARQWDAYLQTYSWQVAFNQPPTRDLAAYAQALLSPSRRAVPSAMSLFVETEAGHRYEIRVVAFDEAETMAAFQTLSQGSPQSPITLFVEVSKDFKKGTLTLRNERQQIPLTKTQVQLFDEN